MIEITDFQSKSDRLISSLMFWEEKCLVLPNVRLSQSSTFVSIIVTSHAPALVKVHLCTIFAL